MGDGGWQMADGGWRDYDGILFKRHKSEMLMEMEMYGVRDSTLRGILAPIQPRMVGEGGRTRIV
jgi:hypothetical protein